MKSTVHALCVCYIFIISVGALGKYQMVWHIVENYMGSLYSLASKKTFEYVFFRMQINSGQKETSLLTVLCKSLDLKNVIVRSALQLFLLPELCLFALVTTFVYTTELAVLRENYFPLEEEHVILSSPCPVRLCLGRCTQQDDLVKVAGRGSSCCEVSQGPTETSPPSVWFFKIFITYKM